MVRKGIDTKTPSRKHKHKILIHSKEVCVVIEGMTSRYDDDDYKGCRYGECMKRNL
jgi:hypothetical protein